MPAATNESISAGPGAIVGRHAGQHEDAGADDRADAEAGELDRAEHAAQPLLALQLVVEHRQRFPQEQLIGQRAPPSAGC